MTKRLTPEENFFLSLGMLDYQESVNRTRNDASKYTPKRAEQPETPQGPTDLVDLLKKRGSAIIRRVVTRDSSAR